MARPRRTNKKIDRGGAAVPKGNYAVPALEKAFDIIELLADIPEGATMNEIATRLGRSIGEIFRIVVVMERRDSCKKGGCTERSNSRARASSVKWRSVKDSPSYGLSDKTAGQPFCAAAKLPARRSARMHFVQQQARRA